MNLGGTSHYEKVTNRRKEFQLIGIGRWHNDDDELLPHFIHVNCRKSGKVVDAPFSMTIPHCSQRSDIVLKNVADDRDGSTVRCIRFFSPAEGKIDLIRRIDWEPAPKARPKPPLYTSLDRILRQAKKTNVENVVIDDHMKGIINIDLIHKIKRCVNEQTRWFVRTKNPAAANVADWPDWMKSIGNIYLLVLGPEICCRDYPVSGLFLRKEHIAAHPFGVLDKLNRRQDSHNANIAVQNIVLTSDKLEVVGLTREGQKLTLTALAAKSVADPQYEQINWTTALFASITYEMLYKRCFGAGGFSGTEFAKIIEKGASNARRHSGLTPGAFFQGTTKKVPWQRAEVGDWSRVHDQWHEAKRGLGLISGNRLAGARLEIWRAASDLPGYIACIDEKRWAVQRIWRQVHRFGRNKSPRASLSILLQADPGIGKTHLARTLADQINCSFITHDIAQMIHRDELLDLFEMIAAAQAEHHERPVFVFVDEVNALLDDSPVYGAFLSPLEAGNYLRRGRRFQLRPCIWMFAATPSEECHSMPEDEREKRKDFVSRLTMIEEMDYRSMCEKAGKGTRVADQARLEQTYMGALMINRAFNDVHKVDKDILRVFQALPPETAPARQIRRLAYSLENVQYGRVHKANCTSQEWRKAIDECIPAHERDHWSGCNPASVTYVTIDPKM